MGGGAGAAMKVVLLLILSLNLQAKAGGNANTKNFVHEWCKRTVINDLCVSIIDADPRSELKNSPQGLCCILRDRAEVEVSAAKKRVLHYLNNNNKNHTFNHYAVQCLQFSIQRYDSMLYNLKIADFNFSVINITTYTDGVERMGSIFYSASNCEECFVDRPGTTPSPMTSQNLNIQNICIVIGSILSFLYCNNAVTCINS